MTAPEPTPLERAAEAVRNMVADDAEVQAQEIVTALMAGDWLERVLGEHGRLTWIAHDQEWKCIECGARVPDVGTGYDSAMAHQAAALVAYATGVGL